MCSLSHLVCSWSTFTAPVFCGGVKPHFILPRAWITRGFRLFFFFFWFSSITNLKRCIKMNEFLNRIFKCIHLIPGAFSMICSLIALLNFICARNFSAFISINRFLMRTSQVVKRFSGEGATLVLCIFLISFARPNFHSKINKIAFLQLLHEL